MCGITGIAGFNEEGWAHHAHMNNAVAALAKRGPDNAATYQHAQMALAHARLSILDTSAVANQPFTDESGRYTLVFNGEIYNFKELYKPLKASGTTFRSQSDTEVLLHLLIREGKGALEKLNGFFAFAFYDSHTQKLLLARDRMGIKPLLYFADDDKFVFASEMKALLAYKLPKKIDQTSLHTYFQLNYIPAPHTILEGYHKLLPGHCITVEGGKVNVEQYYKLPPPTVRSTDSYEQAQTNIRGLLEDAVALRMVSDVPLGSFLSGGIDSSVIATLAARQTSKLRTFSIGYKDEPFFDETAYARLVAKRIKTDHTVFSLSNDDLFGALDPALDYFDEPFADSSALAVFILAQHTRKEVTVALSGDGADEMFSGYNKHSAELKARQASVFNGLVRAGAPLWNMLPHSRSAALGNKMRQLSRFAEGLQLSPQNRYWRWASFLTPNNAANLLLKQPANEVFEARQELLLASITGNKDFNEVLLTDLQLVLPNDMLTKVDLMSMANSLEVRTPFLDHRLVEYVCSLPPEYKINKQLRKRVLQDAFRQDLPPELYNRSKKGFEVPLLSWFREGLRSRIENEWLSDEFIREQGIFNPAVIAALKTKLFSQNPGDAHATVWALIVFQNWWQKYLRE